MKTITLQQLKDADACKAQVRLFEKTFGGEVEVTVGAALEYAQVFDFDFAARNFLEQAARKAYNEATAAAWKAYNEATAAARKAYDEAMAPAWKAYYEAIAAAWKAYEKEKAPAWKAYEEAKAAARKAYEEATAVAFATAYLNQQEK